MSEHERKLIEEEIAKVVESVTRSSNQPLARAILAASGGVITSIVLATWYLSGVVFTVNELKAVKPTVEQHTTQIAVINSKLNIR